MLCGFGSKIRGQLSRCGDPALTDPSALPDPFIGGVQAMGEFVIANDTFRQVCPTPGDLRSQAHHRGNYSVAGCGADGTLLRRANSTRILSRKPFTFMSTATPIALAKPKASVEP